MTKPVRLRLSRKRGFDLQAHSRSVNSLPAVSVARPGKWGNPFAIGKQVKDDSGIWRELDSPRKVVTAFETMLCLAERNYPPTAEIVSELRGKNLACWCAPDAPCHADVLLRLANGGDA